jgi:general secretion pathway protein H
MQYERSPRNSSKVRPYGFTLLELLVVFAILGLVVAFVPTALVKLQEAVQYQDLVRNVVSDLRQVKQQSQAQGVPKRFVVNLKDKTYGVEGAPMRSIPQAISVKATVGTSLISNDGLAQWVFLPDGGATGGTLELIRPSSAGTRIRVDWFAGEILHEPLQP